MVGGDVNGLVGGGVSVAESFIGARADNFNIIVGETLFEAGRKVVVFIGAKPRVVDGIVTLEHELDNFAGAEGRAGVLSVSLFGKEGFHGGGEEGVGGTEEGAASNGDKESNDKGGETTVFAFAGEGSCASSGELTGAGVKSAWPGKGGLFTTAKIAGTRHG